MAAATRLTSMRGAPRGVLNLSCLLWNVPSIALGLNAVPSRGHSDVALEDPREVALIGKPRPYGDRGDARAAAGELPRRRH